MTGSDPLVIKCLVRLFMNQKGKGICGSRILEGGESCWTVIHSTSLYRLSMNMLFSIKVRSCWKRFMLSYLIISKRNEPREINFFCPCFKILSLKNERAFLKNIN